MYRLILDGRVVRLRTPVPGARPPKARWVIHVDTCEHAGGCEPLADLVEEMGEHGVMGRISRGLIARCKTCRPTLLAPR